MKIGSKIQRINRWSWVVGGSKIGEQDEEVQISSYKINKSWGCHIQHKEYGQ